MSAQIHQNCHDILASKRKPITAAMLNSKNGSAWGPVTLPVFKTGES